MVKKKTKGSQQGALTEPAEATVKPAEAAVPPTRRRPRQPVSEAVTDRKRKRQAMGVDVGTIAAAPLSPDTGAQPGPALSADDSQEQRSRDNNVLMEAVVKVFCVHSEPNFSLPWQRKRQYSSTSSGFVISGRRILTNAHSVDYHTQVKVKRRGSDEKFVAHVLAVGTECDIALLTVHEDSFWEGVEHVRFGVLPRLQDSITVIGYPIGGDTLSVTSGVVSRIEVTSYVHGSAELLGIQIDAAINSGNSGGPSFNSRGECVGIAFQSLRHEEAENIGYVIPPPVIQHFIQDYERHGRYTGFPALGIEWQKMESPSLRTALGMQANQKGVLIRRVEPTCPSSAILQAGDILMAFDGVDIASDGTVTFRSGERISFSYLVSNKYTGDTAHLKLFSQGAVKEVDVGLAAPTRLIPVHISNRPPSYFIFAGLVFTPVSVPYLRSEYGKDFEFDSPVMLLEKMMHGMAQNKEQQVVVLGQVLANDASIGYEEIVNTAVKAVNGSTVNNLKELVELVQGCKDRFIKFSLEYNQTVILETEAGRKATAQVLTTHCISSDRSADLLPQ